MHDADVLEAIGGRPTGVCGYQLVACPSPPFYPDQAEIKNNCVVCPAHGTYFDLDTGAVKGEWCPKVRQEHLMLVEKLKPRA